MTDQQHPTITPPFELKQRWLEQAPRYRDGGIGRAHWLIDRASEWGYEQRGEVNDAELQQARDEELEATLAEVSFLGSQVFADRVRALRRPKPPTRAEIALEQYDRCVSILQEKGYFPAGCIRDALVRAIKLEESNG